MTKAKAIILISFILIFAAGAAVGVSVQRSGERPRHRPGLFGGLDLTPEQREEVQRIWFGQTGPDRPHMFDQVRRLEEEREQAVLDLLTEEQRALYDELMQAHERKLNEFSEERRRDFESKVEQTMEVLTESQREKFGEFIEESRERGRQLLPGSFGGPGHGRLGGPRRENRSFEAPSPGST